ncbi:hypothetical protein ELE36_13840 [Pseudolysobacter antarcticus]|uniref:Glycosyltransferase RgtA/B/C/D-like domain-containing protein n=1 Tax=Pseudolysobacter antarcticus TaxID=2511995 RepID=A0A411HLE0_9GAMM|nr:hypothetical protein [Pseudolysobacter antarcticus]QBB71346.1 hypothetical protein ELE36_13840 [Pseudolysobacter antarcticus]
MTTTTFYPERFSRLLAGLALCAITALVYWPALRSYFVFDDFTLVTYSRLLRNPLLPFVQEHFPGSPYFRPLGMALWWLSVQCFGNAIKPQYAINLLLHIAVTLVLWRLLRTLTSHRLLAWLVALLFAVHPIAIGTSLWLADRFDLLGALFGFAALRAAYRYRSAAKLRYLLLTLMLLLLALAAKETSLVMIGAIGIVWIWPRADSQRYWSGEVRASALLLAVGIGWFGWRAWMVGFSPSGSLVSDAPLLQVIANGAMRWGEDFLRYLVAWARLPLVAQIVFTVAALVVIAASIKAATHTRLVLRSEFTLKIVSALILIVLAALIQAPMALVWPQQIAASLDAKFTAVHSRLFYFSLAGAAILAAVLLDRLIGTDPGAVKVRMRMFCAGGAMLIALSWGFASHQLAHDYRRDSRALQPLAEAATLAVEQATLPTQHCQIYLLNIGPEWGLAFKSIADEVVKALLRDISRAQHCLIQSEYTPWLHLLAQTSVTPASVAPMLPIYRNGLQVPWLDIGGVQVAYLNLFPSTDARELRDALFFSYRQGHFEDISAAVRAGEYVVHFTCARSGRQCVCPGDGCPAGNPLPP